MVEREALRWPAVPRIPLAAESENFRCALQWAADRHDYATISRLAAPLIWLLWIRQGQLSEAQQWLHLAREHRAEYPLWLQAKVLSAARRLAGKQGELLEGARLCEEALTTYRELRDAEGVCGELMARGHFAAWRGDRAGNRVALKEAILIARDHELTALLAHGIGNLGDLAIEECRLHEARALCEEGVEISRESGIPPAVALINLAQCPVSGFVRSLRATSRRVSRWCATSRRVSRWCATTCLAFHVAAYANVRVMVIGA